MIYTKIKVNTIKTIQKSVTRRIYSDAALHEIAQETEKWIADVIKKCEALLLKQNELRVKQGLRPKEKVSDDVVLEILEK